MRRFTPFVAVAAIFAVQSLAGAPPVVAFPLYLTVVLLVALQQDRAEAIAVALAAAVAALLVPVAGNGPIADVAQAVLLGAVLVGVAAVMTQLAQRARESAAATRREFADLAADDRLLRETLENATVGLGLTDQDGRWTFVNEPLAVILGRGSDELAKLPLRELVADGDRASLDEALSMMRSGDLAR
ncbi:MAG TPA: PAS domain S-box protein, partial [Candidatus Dormibacteraeota bacterium]|nr:PAS domain S-box protein [Candidatus Dormibacteraeota bacterium]